MKGLFILILAVFAGIYFWPSGHSDVRNMLAATHRVQDIENGWRVCDPTRRATRAVVCVHGLLGNRAELAAFAPVILRHCPECAVYLLDWGWFATGLELPVTETPVTLIGMSHGAVRAMEHTRVDGVVALAPYASFRDVIIDKIMTKAPINALQYVERFVDFVLAAFYKPPVPNFYNNAKLLLVHGKRDKLVPIKHSERLLKKAIASGARVERCAVDDAWHVPSQLLNDKKCREKILKIIK